MSHVQYTLQKQLPLTAPLLLVQFFSVPQNCVTSRSRTTPVYLTPSSYARPRGARLRPEASILSPAIMWLTSNFQRLSVHCSTYPPTATPTTPSLAPSPRRLYCCCIVNVVKKRVRMPQKHVARQFLPSASNVRRVLALPSSVQCDYNTQLSFHTLAELLNLFPSQSQPC